MSISRLALWAAGLFLAVCGWTGAAIAQGTVENIVVEGTQRIEPESVRSYLAIKPGDQFDPVKLDESLKTLFATGLFADVAIDRRGGTLVVRVQENPIINRVAFEGNRRIDEEELLAEVQLQPRQVLTRAKVQNDVGRILELYRRNGRFAVSVEPKIIQLEQNRVDLVFEIAEGPATYVRRINFIGNNRFSDSTLREEIATKEERWYRFYTSNDTYDPDRLAFDQELLRRFYRKNGYADFRVLSAVAELTPDQSGFFITITIEEGPRYRFGPQTVEASLRDLEPGALQPLVVAEDGDWYDAEEVEDTVQAITDAVGARGYAFVDVRPRVTRNREARTISIVYDVQEGPRVFVERIDITGNVRTLDRVIRREVQLVEGDAFNTAKLRRSRQRIQDLNFFDKVDVTNVPSEEAPDRTVVKVDVQEKSTGELSFGLGFSSSGGAGVDVGVRERNLLGRAQVLRLNASLSQRRSQVDFSFTEPYFLDRRLAAGVDAFQVRQDLQDESSYDVTRLGAGLRIGFNYNDALSHAFRYGLSEEKVENIGNDASLVIRQLSGSSVLSEIGHALLYDKRDSRRDPTEGFFVGFSNDIAGLGGDETYLRSDVRGGQYWTFFDDVTVGLTGNAGYIVGFGEDVRLSRTYQLGGGNLRGFADFGASPRDALTDDRLGGNWVATGTAEMRFPLGLPEEFGVKGKAFADVGSIGDPDGVSNINLDSSQELRLSLGTGVLWTSPFGPISVDLGFPLLKASGDKTEVFRVNFGTRF